MVNGGLRRQRSVRRLRVIALVATAALVAGACGSGDGESTSSVDSAPTTVSDRDDDFIANSSESTSGTSVESTPAESDTAVGGRGVAKPDPDLPVSIIEIDFDAGTITIANHGIDELDLGDVWLCEFPSYEQLDAQVVAAGESVTIDNPHDSSADDGELALYRTNDFGNADAILSYVEWGSTDHTRESVAVEAGLWGTDAVDAGLTLTTDGMFAADASDWSVLVSLSGEQRSAPPTSAPKPDNAPPPDDYSPAAPSPTSPPTTARPAPPPPPDDYSPATPPPPRPPTTPRPPPPPPDEY